MQQNHKRAAALALAAAMVLGGLTAYADGESNANALTIGASQPPVVLMSDDTEPLAAQSVTYQYYNGSGFAQGTAEATLIANDTTAWSDGWYVASGNVTISQRVEVSGDVHLILEDECSLTITGGIHLPTGSSLTIYGQEEGSGKLTATAADQSNVNSGANAGIGGNGSGFGVNGESGGNVTIHGGQVTAIGGSARSQYTNTGGGAGIGGGGGGGGSYGGSGGNAGSIVIYGGTVTASGGGSVWYGGGGAGIGGGGSGNNANGGDGGTAIILSQSVQATGGSANAEWATNGADIGGGGSDKYRGTSGQTGQGIRPTADDGFEVYGTLELPVSITVPEGATLTVPEGASLTVPEGETLTLPAGTTLKADGGTLNNNGTIMNKGGTLEGEVTGTGQIIDGTAGEQQPSEPTKPATGTAATDDAQTTIQQMETAERPDPQDIEATERYNFWMGVKSDLRSAADGKTLRVHVPARYENMPASVMEQIRLLDREIAVDLRWNGKRLLITPDTAQRKTALKAYWTFEQLCELYA